MIQGTSRLGLFRYSSAQDEPSKYYSHKVPTIILPLVVYSIVLYLYTTGFSGASVHGHISYFSDALTPWWFIPDLIPYLLIAPFLYWQFERLSDRQAKRLQRSRSSSSHGASSPMFLHGPFGAQGTRRSSLSLAFSSAMSPRP